MPGTIGTIIRIITIPITGASSFVNPMRFVALVSFLCGIAIPTLADGANVPLSDLPAAVQSVIHVQVADGTMGDIAKETQDEDTVYDVALTDKAGTDRDFTISQDGTLLSVEIPLAEAPTAVKDVIQTELHGGSLVSIDKNLADSEITFDIAGTAKHGKTNDFTVSDDGAILSREVILKQTPDAVQKTIAAHLHAGTLAGIEENFDDDSTNFDISVTMLSGASTSFNVTLAGALASEQVPLSEVPPLAQRAIQARLVHGTVLRVDKSAVKKMGVSPFQVEGRIDGRPVDFSIGPRGRFLGMD